MADQPTSSLSIARVPFSSLSHDSFHTFKSTLTPFVATGCLTEFPRWKSYGEFCGLKLCTDAELGGIGAECSAMTDVERPRYYSDEACPVESDDTMSNHSSMHFEANDATAFRSPTDGLDPSPLLTRDKYGALSRSVSTPMSSTIGGIDIYDVDSFTKEKLLSLKVSDLQHRHSRNADICDTASLDANSCSDARSNLSHSASQSLSDVDKRHTLTLQNAREIILDRKTLCAQFPQQSVADDSLTVLDVLRRERGRLYVKAPIQMSKTVMDAMELASLLLPRSRRVMQPAIAALRLQPGTFVAYAMLSEKDAGSRSHVSVKGSHMWHVLLSGRKQWVIVHSLDKHLVIDRRTGETHALADEETWKKYQYCRHARVFRFIQEAGEAVFIPSDALHCEVSLQPSVAVQVNFMDSTTKRICQKYNRDYEILEAPQNQESFHAEQMPLTTVDIMLFSDNVYPSFRGKKRQYRPDTRQTTLLLRGVTEFSQIRMPCSELGARLELDAFQSAFSPLGETLLNHYDPPRFVVGVPKGYIASQNDNRLILYFFVEPHSLNDIQLCLRGHPHVGRSVQHFTCMDITLPEIDLFHSTASHQGWIPNYVPLSVIFNQTWPFERHLCQNLVTLAHIILEKAYHPLGFLRPGSVWHYARFDIHPDANKKGSLAAAKEIHRKQDGCSFARRTPTSATRLSAPKHAVRLPKTSFPRVMSSFEYVDLDEEHPGEGWCQTFLFYCSPLMEKPVAMHPLQSDATLQDGREMMEAGRCPTFSPRLFEFEWNAERLEQYGMVSLLQLEENGLSEIKQTILTDSSFERFERFVQDHCMKTLDHNKETNIEKVMSVVMWFMCRPSIVGFTFGGVLDSADTTPWVDGSSTPFGEFPIESEVGQWDTVCLTATAASAFLTCVTESAYADLATKLCNWLCNIPNGSSAIADDDVFRHVERVLTEGSVEEQAVLFQVLRIKRSLIPGMLPSSPRNEYCKLGGSAYALADISKIKQLEEYCEEVERRNVSVA